MYLSQPLLDHHREYLADYARQVLVDGGEQSMIASMEDLAEDGGVATHAPILYSNLRASGAPSVTSDGRVIYDRPPRQHRLSDAELRALWREHHPIPSRFTAKQLRFLWSRGF